MICEPCKRPRIAGSAFWNWACDECEKHSVHSNTAVPFLCKECAEQHNKCEDCGKDLEDANK